LDKKALLIIKIKTRELKVIIVLLRLNRVRE
jgi:hypothetical protein